MIHGTSLILAGLFSLGSAGCVTQRLTDPEHTATERFLMSQAVVRAVEQLSAGPLRDKLVCLDSSYLAESDRTFLLAEVRARLLTSGVRLTDKRDAAKVIVEIRSAGVGTDRHGYIIGIPTFTLLGNPELGLAKDQVQRGFASVALVAFWADTGELLAASGPFIGRTLREDYWVMGTGPRTIGDIPTAQRLLPTTQPQR